MRKTFLLIIAVGITLLSGCTQVRDLTDDQTKLIAEYAADILLKHDRNYENRLEDGSSEEQELLLDNTETTTEEVATEATTQESTTEITDKPNTEESVQVVPEEAVVGSESNIAKIAGIEGADIQYKDYLITDRYPATDTEGDFIYLEASEGYQLLVVRFSVANTTQEVLPVSLIDKELDYRIVCNGKNAAKPMLTILMDDLGTLEMSIEPEKAQEAVLVFQISDSMKDKLETIELFIHYNEMDNMIKIL